MIAINLITLRPKQEAEMVEFFRSGSIIAMALTVVAAGMFVVLAS